MCKYLGQSTKVFSHFGNDYDKGHFIAHYSGGPIDINLFPQHRDVNRGWSSQGRNTGQWKDLLLLTQARLFFRTLFIRILVAAHTK